MTRPRETQRPGNQAANAIDPADAPALSDCDPAMPRTLPFALEVDAHTATLDGRFIANVPAGGLL